MARIFDVVEYPSEMADEIVHRFPEQGIADLRIGSQVIVREAQRAVFFRDGRALDSFGPCLLYTSPSPRDRTRSRMPSSA